MKNKHQGSSFDSFLKEEKIEPMTLSDAITKAMFIKEKKMSKKNPGEIIKKHFDRARQEHPEIFNRLENVSSNSEGVKYDGGKPKLSLLPLQGVLEVAKVGAMGAKKYGDHNFRGGMALTRFLDAALRHQLAYLDGIDKDEESGLTHLAHAAWNLLAAIEQQMRKPELDDRHYKPKKESLTNELEEGIAASHAKRKAKA